ncbi:cobalt-precorrin 5A hydrolase [Candidatus Contubernalis alkaliaceticus]|uniref:cobalt-precorrin 5A hydrolase n=1 Tax=Candidatus Contubernalis alkaliaceticus TaxID=338645 RepID=UPI001F4C224F|nr:cobalt-precorrin 5A hydrolase [Candidatus Contubernalis alkalaceticus]UNC92496.1 cobalt-precorrin 5A hydrolase [Candidatus Contubernalis alkalaceticus]
MKIAVLALTRGGELTAVRIQRSYTEGEVDLFLPEKLKSENSGTKTQKGRTYYKGSFKETFCFLFKKYRALVCIMAAGIVVRTLASLLKDKYEDPAVVVLDEQGEFAVSLLSGHLGGANALAGEIAQKIGAQAVVTTATDVCNKPAVEMLARDWKLVLEPRENIKRINWALADGLRIKVFVDGDIQVPPIFTEDDETFEGPYPYEVPVCQGEKGTREKVSGSPCLIISNTLFLEPVTDNNTILARPQNIVLGVGCKRGTSQEDLISFIQRCFQEEGISPLCLKKIVSIDIKNNEEGLLEAARRLKVHTEFLTEEQIKNVKVEVSRSKFVEKITGVGCVCEPAALFGAGREELLWKKKKNQGMTTAAARVLYRWWE